MTNWIQKAKQIGFDTAVSLVPARLEALPSIREMCAADKCRAYGKNWTCPPECGTLEECSDRMRCYQRGILLQTVGQLSKTIDTKAYRETEQRHLEQFHSLAQEIRKEFPDALCLGSGGCRVCRTCAHPAPCRFPAQALSSMEAYGLFVTQVCRDCGVPYHYGPMTIAYTACILF